MHDIIGDDFIREKDRNVCIPSNAMHLPYFLNKLPDAYLLYVHGFQATAVKRDRAFVPGQALISYRLFQRNGRPTTFADCGPPTWFLNGSSKRPPTTAAMAFFCGPNTYFDW